MCITQFLYAYRIEIVISVVSGLVTGALTSAYVTLYFRRKDLSFFVIDRAKDLARDCHYLLDISTKLITQIALRKYRAYEIMEATNELSGENKRRSKNKKAMEISAIEVSEEEMNQICLSIKARQLESAAKARKLRRLRPLISAMDSAVNAALGLLHSSGEDRVFQDFHDYLTCVESTLGDVDFEEFIRKLDEEDCSRYKHFKTRRQEFRDMFIELITSITKSSAKR